MAYSALEVAKYVINHEHEQGREISNLRLQKLLYFVQAKVLVETGQPCFDDVMEAWEYGPVLPVVYQAFRKYGNLPIEKQDFVIIDRFTSDLIDDILDFFAGTPTFQLVQITHNQTPWIMAKKMGNRAAISNDAIKNFFSH